MATPFRKSVKWYFTDCDKIAEFDEMRSLDGKERDGEGGIGAIIFFASQGRPKMHNEGAAMAMAAAFVLAEMNTITYNNKPPSYTIR